MVDPFCTLLTWRCSCFSFPTSNTNSIYTYTKRNYCFSAFHFLRRFNLRLSPLKLSGATLFRHPDSMDSSFYNESNKLNVLKSSNIPKQTTTPVRNRGSYYSSPENLIKYLRSNSVSSSGGNSGSSGKSCFRSSVSPQSEKTPLKVVDEDVFVMDGVLVASDTNIIGSGSSSSGSIGFYKSEICRAWEEFGHCRYGSKCQFAHGKEDVRPTCFPFRTKSEAQVYKSYASTVPNTFASKPRLVHPLTETTTIITQKDSSTRPEETIINSLSTLQPETTRPNANITMKPKTNKISPTSTIGPNWSPQDDGIDVTLPTLFPSKTPSRENIDAYIDRVLYGGCPTTEKRLPVFSAFCPE